MARKLNIHCRVPGCTELRHTTAHCVNHDRMFASARSFMRGIKAQPPESEDSKVMVIDTNGDLLVMEVKLIERIPAKKMKSKNIGVLVNVFGLLAYRGFRLMQMIAPDDAAAVVDEARAEKVEVA